MNWLSVANPALGLCFLGVSIPIVIHLLNRHDPKRIEFPTIRFLALTLTQRSVLHRFRHLILLLLRAAFIALIAFAFLKPFVGRTGPAAAVTGGRTAALIVLDASASMRYSRRGTTPFARAKAEAAQILDSLGKEDHANLVVARAVPRASFPKPGPNMPGLRRDLDRAKPSAERADFGAALRMAAAQLDGDESATKELYIFSDFQRSNWSDVDMSALRKDCRVSFVDVGLPKASNHAVVSVTARPRTPVASEPLQIICEVANFSRKRDTIPVRLSFEDGAEMTLAVSADPFMSVPASFSCRMDRPGMYAAAISVPDDDLQLDNERFAVLTVRQKVRVLLLSDADPRDRRSGAYFLARALKPYRDDSGALALDPKRPARLATLDLSIYDVVFVIETHAMGTPEQSSLFHYLEGGGSVAWFLGTPGERENVAALGALGKGARVTPFDVGELFDLSGQRDTFTYFREANFAAPMLRLFRDPERGDLSAIRFYKFHHTVGRDDMGEILLKYEDGTIAMGKRNVGSGTLLLCNFSPAPKASTLARSVNFVPMIHEMIRHLRPVESGQLGTLAGEPAQTTIESGAVLGPLDISGPKGAGPAVVTDRVGDRTFATVHGADVPGIYRISSGTETVALLPVNVHPDESDLRKMDTDPLMRRTPAAQRHFLRTDEGANFLADMRTGRPIWHHVLLAALFVICVEQILTHRWRRR